MSFISFAIRFKLEKDEYGIVDRSKKYAFLDQEFLIDLDEDEIPDVANKLCGDDTFTQNQFIRGVQKIKQEQSKNSQGIIFIDITNEKVNKKVTCNNTDKIERD